MIKNVTLIGTFVVLGLVVAGCGDSDGGSDAPSAISAAAADFMFTPDAWIVAADKPFDVTFTNDGSAVHEWAVLAEGVTISSEAEFSEDMVEFEIDTVAPGTTETRTFTLAAGTYQVICAIPSHFDLGMEGILSVSP